MTPFPSRVSQPNPVEESISYVTAIAALSGAAPQLIAIVALHLLAGVAGHNSWVGGPAGEVIRPGYSLLVAGGDDPRWQRALDLLTAPLLAWQNRSREISRGCRADVLREQLRAEGKAADTLNQVKDGAINMPFGDGIKVNINRRYDVLSKPLVLLEAPDLASYSAGMKEVMDREALILYRDGRLLEQALARRPPEQIGQLVQALARAIGGFNEHVPEKNRAVDLCEMERTQVTLHISASSKTIREALRSEQQGMTRLMSGSVVLPLFLYIDQLPTFSRSQLKNGYQQWRQTVMDVFTARRTGGGMRFELDGTVHATLMGFTQELFSRVNNIPEARRASFRPLMMLHYKMMWGAMAASEFGHLDVQTAIDLTRWVFDQQQSLLEEIGAEDSLETRAAFKDRICQKLKLKSPCTRRTLVRSFTTQRVEIFEPVLQELADERRIRRLDSGLIELMEEAPVPQEATSMS